MYDQISVELTSNQPSLQNNGELANQFAHWSRLIKKVNDIPKKQRTEADEWEKLRLQFMGACYVASEKDDGPIVWPSENLEALIRDGAKKQKNGQKVLSGVQVPEDAPLLYKGPKTRKELWEDEEFRFIRRVKMKGSGSTVLSARPIFRDWKVAFKVNYVGEVITPEEIRDALDAAGVFIGLSDWKKKYGLFTVTKFEEVAKKGAAAA